MGLQIVSKWVIDNIFNFGEPALFNGMIIYGSMDLRTNPGNCRAVRISNGTEVWKFPAVSEVRGPVLIDRGVLFFSGIYMTQPNTYEDPRCQETDYP